MPKGRQSLASMSVEALISLRENVARVLREQGEHLRQQLQRLEIEGRRSSGRKAATGTKGRGGKLPPKYRDPENPSNVWAGRGAIPRWMAEKIKKGAKREDFLIGSSGTSPARKKSSGKKTSKRAKTKSSARGRAGAKTRAKSKVKAPRAARKRARRAVAAPNAAATPAPSSGSGGQE